MAEESDFLALQKITCKPEAQPDVEPEVCPDCVPNPNFIDLNIFIDLDQAYYNEATCEYCYIFNPETQLENDESLKEAEDRIKNEVEKGNLDPIVITNYGVILKNNKQINEAIKLFK